MKYILYSLTALFATSLAGAADNLVAYVKPTAGNDAMGVVTFTGSEDGGITLKARISGLNPNSKHGFHVHEFGDLSADDAKSAGSHFNPEDVEHALPGEEGEHPGHAGDFGNLTANDEGVAEMTMNLKADRFPEGLMSLAGRAVIVHAKPDDGGQPTGNAGDRIGAGILAVQNPEVDPFSVDMKNDDAQSKADADDTAPLVAAGDSAKDPEDAVETGVTDTSETTETAEVAETTATEATDATVTVDSETADSEATDTTVTVDPETADPDAREATDTTVTVDPETTNSETVEATDTTVTVDEADAVESDDAAETADATETTASADTAEAETAPATTTTADTTPAPRYNDRGEPIEEAAEDIGRAAEKTGRAVATGVEKAVEGTGRVIKKVGRAVEREIKD